MLATSSIDARIHQVAGPQLGLAHRSQLAEYGIDRHAIQRRVADGRAVRVFPSVVWFGHGAEEMTREQQELAALLAAGPGSALWLETSAARLRMWDRPASTIHVVAPRQVTCAGHVPAVFHRSDYAAPLILPATAPIPVTHPLETIRACGTQLTPHQIAAMLRMGVYERLFTLEEVEAHLGAAAGLPGVAVARRGLELRRAHSAGTRGRSEDRFLDGWLAGGGSEPLVNVRGAAGLPDHEPDFAWLVERVILEIDGEQHANDPIQRAQDEARDRLLDQVGWRVLRMPWRRVWTDLPSVIVEVADELDRRG